MADRDVKPAFSLKKTSGRWKVELVNFQKFDEVLTQDVLNAFCRCFVHSDRLTSTTSCIAASAQLHGKDSIVFSRDLLTMVWFTVGTLRELALALKDLRSDSAMVPNTVSTITSARFFVRSPTSATSSTSATFVSVPPVTG